MFFIFVYRKTDWLRSCAKRRNREQGIYSKISFFFFVVKKVSRARDKGKCYQCLRLTCLFNIMVMFRKDQAGLFRLMMVPSHVQRQLQTKENSPVVTTTQEMRNFLFSRWRLCFCVCISRLLTCFTRYEITTTLRRR